MDVIGCDRFSRSRENGVLIIPRREGRGGFSSVIRFEEDGSNLHSPSPFHIRPYFSSLSLSFSVVLFLSQPGSLLVKIQFVAAHRMENKKTGAVELALRNGRYLTKLFAPQGGGWLGFLSGRG